MPEPHKETHEAETLTAYGSEIKMLDDGKIGGYLVRFGSPDDTDLEGDFFTADTDFGSASKSVTLWDHSMDPVLGDIELGEVTMKKTDIGVWVEGVLSLRADYEKYLNEEFGDGGSEKFLKAIKAFIKGGVAGWSSGVPAHRVRRQEIKDTSTGATKARHIIKWPLGLDASITPTPAEPRNKVVSLKSIDREHTINWKSLLANDEPESGAEESKGQDSPPEVKSDADSREGAEGVYMDGKLVGYWAVDALNQQTDNKETMADEQKNVEPQEAKEAETKAKDTSGNDEVLKRLDALQKQFEESRTVKGVREIPANQNNTGAPAFIREPGDNLANAFKAWVKKGDTAGLRHLLTENEQGQEVVEFKTSEIKASNATDMNTVTAADGGNTVTDDMHGEIIRRADEMSLAARAGVRRFRSSANVLDVSLDNEADSEFVTTTEATDFDEDAPAIGQKVLTKVAKTKYVDVSYQLLEASSVDILDHIQYRVAVGKAKTDNGMLIDEVEANGTEFKIFAGTAAIAVDEIEEVAINDTNAFYVENPDDAKFIMRPSTHRSIITLDDANMRRYSENALGSLSGRDLLGHDVLWSNKCEAIGSGLKPVLFGNFNYVGQLEDPGLQFLRDPYTVAIKGQVRLLWYYRTVFGVLQAGAVGYGRNITT